MEKMTNTEKLGTTLESAATALDECSSNYTKGLERFGAAERDLGKAERLFIREVIANCVEPMKKFIAEEFDDALKEKSALENNRIDLDIAKNKFERAKGVVDKEKAEKALQVATILN